jgi:hypothetical protein
MRRSKVTPPFRVSVPEPPLRMLLPGLGPPLTTSLPDSPLRSPRTLPVLVMTSLPSPALTTTVSLLTFTGQATVPLVRRVQLRPAVRVSEVSWMMTKLPDRLTVMLFARPCAAFTTMLVPLLNTPVAALAGPPVKVTAEPAIAATTKTRSNAFLPMGSLSVV